MADPTKKGSSSDLAAAVERLWGDVLNISIAVPEDRMTADLRLVLDALDQWRDDANRLAAALRSHWGDPCGHPDCPECAVLDAHDQLAGGEPLRTERAEIVAWLRAQGDAAVDRPVFMALHRAAWLIEDGTFRG